MTIRLLCVVLICAVAIAQEAPSDLPGIWLEMEQGEGHRRTQNFGQASGGQIVGHITTGTVTRLRAQLKEPMAEARLYLRYNLDGGDGAARVTLRGPEGAEHELDLPLPSTGGWDRFAWTSVAIGALPAGAYQLAVSGGEPRTGGMDVLVLLDDRWQGLYLPPERFVRGQPQDKGQVLAPLVIDSAAAQDDAVFAPGAAIAWRIEARNRSQQAVADELGWRVVDRAGEIVARGRTRLELEPGAALSQELELARGLPLGWYRVEFAGARIDAPRAWFSCARAPTPGVTGPGEIRSPWLGMNMGHFTLAELPQVLDDITAVGLRAARTGGNHPDPRRHDPVVDAVLAAGLELHWVINYRGNDIDPGGTGIKNLVGLDLDGPLMQEWFDRYKARCIAIMRHFSSPGAERIRHYLVGNEPALRDPHTGLPGRPDIAVRLTRALFEAAREVNPAAIIVQSPTGHAPDTDYLRQMIVDHGIHRYADVIGTHVYGAQTLDSRLRQPWDFLAEAGVRMPVACTESGVTMGWAHKAKTPGREWQTDYMALHYAKLKRMGYQWGLLFTHDEDHHVHWAKLRAEGEIIQPNWNYIRDVLSQPRPFRNGSFEEVNDPRALWVPDRNIDVQGWMDRQFTWQAEDQVRDGRYALRINQGSWDWDIAALQVVDVGITPGVPVTVSGWIRTSGHAPARLAVGGYNRDAGAETAERTVTASEWTRVEITVTPSNPWIVIIVAATPAKGQPAHAWFDDIQLRVGG